MFLVILSAIKFQDLRLITGSIYFFFNIYQLQWLHKRKSEFYNKEEYWGIIAKISFIFWISTSLICVLNIGKMSAFITLILWIIYLINLYLYLRVKILKNWFSYFVMFFFMYIINLFLIILEFTIFQEAFQISSMHLFTTVYIITIFLPVIITSLEVIYKIREIKVAVYGWVALITIISSFVFLFQYDIEKFILEEIILINFKEEGSLEFYLDDKKNLIKLDNNIRELDLEEHFTLKDELNHFLPSKQIASTIVVEIRDTLSFLLDYAFKLIFLPHIIGASFCCFVIELKERNEWKSKINNYNIL